jgi:NAD+ synthase (glutamine-hydrolysing)
MQLLNVAAAALNQTPLDWNGNRDRIVEALQRARSADVDVICLPELCVTGYGCEDAFHSPATARRALQMLDEIRAHTDELICSVGLPVLYRGATYNASALLVDGSIEGIVAKQNLAGDGVHYEPRWFKAWEPGWRDTLDVGGGEVPIGDIYFDVGGVRLGFEICEDAWVADRPGARMARRGVDLILNPSASHFAFGKESIRRRFVLDGSRAFGVSYLYANLLGNESGRIIYDGGTMIASGGEMHASGPRFSYEDVVVTTAQIDVDRTRMERAELASWEPDSRAAKRDAVEVDWSFPERTPSARGTDGPEWEDSDTLKEEEFTRAVCLGLFDYLRKSHSDGFVVSLSGGADSSATAVLVAQMVRLAVDELGVDGVAEKLGHIDALQPVDAESSARDIVEALLTCVYQSTRNSSEETRTAAAQVAEAIGATYHEWDVDGIAGAYTELLEDTVERELTWQQDDIALQNIQARARAPGIWMLANLKNALLLATSNRSEAAVGYTTMDGDTAGGLSPIAGIDKAFLRRWLNWMRDQGPAGCEAIPALEAVTRQQPSAELRPSSAGQTDESDLMPYVILDRIERLAIGSRYDPLEVLQCLIDDVAHRDLQTLGEWVEDFFRRWSQNQWKRERYAPSFHLDDQNLDPKTWCRFPILSGGFDREIDEMWDWIAARDETSSSE